MSNSRDISSLDLNQLISNAITNQSNAINLLECRLEKMLVRDKPIILAFQKKIKEELSLEEKTETQDQYKQLCLAITYYWENDFVQAKIFFELAAKQKNMTAEFNLGWLYEQGYGCVRNERTAISWYKKSAEKSYGPALNQLGQMYKEGLYIARDYGKAFEYFSIAAEQGWAAAQNNLAKMYEEGVSVSQDYEMAIYWYFKAIEHGNATAANNMGVMISKGLGIKKDIVAAARWFRIAAEQGDKEAEKNLKNLPTSFLEVIYTQGIILGFKDREIKKNFENLAISKPDEFDLLAFEEADMSVVFNSLSLENRDKVKKRQEKGIVSRFMLLNCYLLSDINPIILNYIFGLNCNDRFCEFKSVTNYTSGDLQRESKQVTNINNLNRINGGIWFLNHNKKIFSEKNLLEIATVTHLDDLKILNRHIELLGCEFLDEKWEKRRNEFLKILFKEGTGDTLEQAKTWPIFAAQNITNNKKISSLFSRSVSYTCYVTAINNEIQKRKNMEQSFRNV